MRNRFLGLKPGSLLARLEGLLTALAVAFPNPGIPTLLSPKRRQRALKLSHWKAAAMGGTAVLTMATGVTPAGVAAFSATQAICLQGAITSTAPCGGVQDWNPALFVAGSNGDITYAGAAHKPPSVTGYTGIADFGAPDYANPDRTYFGSSNKDTQDSSTWQCTTINNPANKQDLQNAYAAVYKRTSDGHRLLYVASERYDNSGDAFQGFWFLQNAASCQGPATAGGASTTFTTTGHSADDLLILANYTQGGIIAGINIYNWDTTCTKGVTNPAVGQCAAPNLRVVVSETNDPTCGTTSGDADVACGITNSGSITPPWNISPNLSGTGLVANTFLELGVDLDGPGLSGHVPCGTGFQAETRESQSPTADLKDYVGGPMSLCEPTTTTTQLQKSVSGTWTNMASGSTVETGTDVRDTATITPTPPAAENVTYRLYNGSGCSNNTPTGSLVSSFGTSGADTETYGTGHSVAATGLAPGTYQFQVSWAGDVNALLSGSTSDCGSEVFTVVTPTQTTTQLSSGSVSVGDQVHDTATVTGATSAAGGSVAFTVYEDNHCGTAATTGTGGDISAQPTQTSFTNNSGTITAGSSNVTFQKAGTFYWEAVYSGDLANFTEGSHSACDSEPVIVNAPNLTLTKTADAATVNAGDTVGYTITITNTSSLANAYGVTVSDTVPSNAGLSWSIASQSPADSWTLVGNALSFGPATLGPNASATVHITSGTTAATCGVIHNSASATSTNDGSPSVGPIDITVQCPNLSLTKTAADATSVPAGSPIGYTVTLSNAGPGTASDVLLTDNLPSVPTTSGAPWQILGTPTLTGADLSGVTCAITGSVPTQVLTCGSGLGFSMASGDSISVKLTHATDVTSATTPVDDNPAGTYPNTVTATSTNTAVSPASATEYVEAISTTPSATSALQTPAQVTDTATLAGGNAPTGTVTFKVYGPGDTTCATPLATFTAALDNTGHATSGTYTATQSGTYQWVASYGGDTNNSKVSGVCGDATEQFTTFTAAVLPAVTPAKTGDTTIFMVLGIPFILTGLVLFGLSWRRREEQA